MTFNAMLRGGKKRRQVAALQRACAGIFTW